MTATATKQSMNMQSASVCTKAFSACPSFTFESDNASCASNIAIFADTVLFAVSAIFVLSLVLRALELSVISVIIISLIIISRVIIITEKSKSWQNEAYMQKPM